MFAMFVLRNVRTTHLMQFFFVVLSCLGNKSTVFWKKKEKKKTHRGQKWVGTDERVS